MKNSSLVSKLRSLACPLCEASELCHSGYDSARCATCGCLLSGDILRTLEQVNVLPDASGSHHCECGYPEMRRLSDGIYHCPPCGSEVLPSGLTRLVKGFHTEEVNHGLENLEVV